MALTFTPAAYLDREGVKKVKKIMIYISLGLLAIIMIPAAFFGLRIVFDLGNPLRQSAEQIREDILELTPIGMSMDEAVEALTTIGNERNWGHVSVNHGRGVLYDELGFPSRPEDRALNRRTIIGEHSIRASIGGYQNFFRTFVVVWWAFDENAELIEIYVKKQIAGF